MIFTSVTLIGINDRVTNSFQLNVMRMISGSPWLTLTFYMSQLKASDPGKCHVVFFIFM